MITGVDANPLLYPISISVSRLLFFQAFQQPAAQTNRRTVVCNAFLHPLCKSTLSFCQEGRRFHDPFCLHIAFLAHLLSHQRNKLCFFFIAPVFKFFPVLIYRNFNRNFLYYFLQCIFPVCKQSRHQSVFYTIKIHFMLRAKC